MMHLKQGDAAPDFTAKDQHGNTVSLADFKGKKVILYFYPHDMTPGCTTQACNLRDHYSQLLQKGYAVIGVSEDDEKSHQKFAEKFDLPFPLLVDVDHTILNDYGVWGEKTFMGRTYDGTHRTTFLIDEEGNIAHVIEKPDTDYHAQEILELWEGAVPAAEEAEPVEEVAVENGSEDEVSSDPIEKAKAVVQELKEVATHSSLKARRRKAPAVAKEAAEKKAAAAAKPAVARKPAAPKKATSEVAKKAVAKKTAAPKKAASKVAKKVVAPKKAVAKKAAPKKATSKVAKKAVAPKKAASKVAKKAVAPKKAVAKKATPKKAVAKKAAPKKAAKKSVTPKKAVAKKAASKVTKKVTAPKKAVAKKSAPKKAAPKTAKKAAPKKSASKKVASKITKKAAPKKNAAKNSAPKKAAPKKTAKKSTRRK